MISIQIEEHPEYDISIFATLYLIPLAGLSFTAAIPANTKHLCNIYTMLDQRRRRCADVVQMLYKSFVFAGYILVNRARRLLSHHRMKLVHLFKY